MANSFKIEYKARLNDIIKSDADIAAGRKAALIATVGMVSARALLFVTGMVSAFVNNHPFSALEIAMMCVSVVFGRLIYTGLRPLAILALMGGGMSLWSAWQNGSLANVFHYGNIFTTALGVSFIIAIVLTIVPMAYLLLNSKYKKYADEMGRLRQGIMAEQQKR